MPTYGKKGQKAQQLESILCSHNKEQYVRKQALKVFVGVHHYDDKIRKTWIRNLLYWGILHFSVYRGTVIVGL